jgi:hypothetical protein
VRSPADGWGPQVGATLTNWAGLAPGIDGPGRFWPIPGLASFLFIIFLCFVFFSFSNLKFEFKFRKRICT